MISTINKVRSGLPWEPGIHCTSMASVNISKDLSLTVRHTWCHDLHVQSLGHCQLLFLNINLFSLQHVNKLKKNVFMTVRNMIVATLNHPTAVRHGGDPCSPSRTINFPSLVDMKSSLEFNKWQSSSSSKLQHAAAFSAALYYADISNPKEHPPTHPHSDRGRAV